MMTLSEKAEDTFEICAWCHGEVFPGLVHLPELRPGKCVVVGQKFADEKRKYPVHYLASNKLGILQNEIRKAIIEDLKKMPIDQSAGSLVVNYNMAIMNFCMYLIMDTLDLETNAAHLCFLDQHMKETSKN